MILLFVLVLVRPEGAPTIVYVKFLANSGFGYCYHSVNVITLALYQSDHIKRLPLIPICAKAAVLNLGYIGSSHGVH
jgi:hypothetical protein